MKRKKILRIVLISVLIASAAEAQEYPLQLYLEKSSSRGYELTKKEKADLLDQIQKVLERAKEVQSRLTRMLQGGETDLKYQEGKFWMTRLQEDQQSIELGAQQLKVLREKPMHLVPAIRLYKSLKDLSAHFNGYNNIVSFSVSVGEVAPELELWADPVFYKLYLLPLAESKTQPGKMPPKEKRSEGKKRG